MVWMRALLLCSLTAFASSAAAQAASIDVKTEPSMGPRELSAPRSQASQASSDEGCLLGDFCVGPLLTLGAVDPLGFGAHMRYGRYLGFGIDYQFLPTRIDIGAASATWSLFTVEARVYPFGNAFFLGGGFGYQNFSARVHQMTPIGDVALSGSLGMPALKLGIGFMGHDGFVLGADIGFNVLLGRAKVDMSDPTGPGANYPTGAFALEQEINEVAEDAVASFPVIPQINLIRMGYLF
jgi:hypothetical protein